MMTNATSPEAIVLDTVTQFPSFTPNASSSDDANEAIVLLSRHLTFSELEKRTSRLAEQLIGDAGRFRLPVGALVAFIGTVELEIPELVLAAWTAGLRLLPIPDILTSAEVNDIVDEYKPEVLFCTRSHWAKIADELGSSRGPELASPRVFVWDAEEGSDDEPSAPIIPPDGTSAYEDFIDGWRSVDVAAIQAECAQNRVRNAEEDFVYFLTSGTTGKPKLVRVSLYYFQELLNAMDGYFWTGVESGLLVGYQSFAWVGGMMTFMTFITRGRPVVMIRGYDFEAYCAAIMEHRPTHMMWLPMCFEDMCSLPPNELQRMRDSLGSCEVLYGGACFPLSLVRRAVETFPAVSIVQVYGSTEVGLVGKLSKEDHLHWFEYLDQNPKAPQILPTVSLVNESSTGVADVKILDPETRSELPHWEVGDIVIGGSNGGAACSGYLNAPDKEKDLFLDAEARGAGGYLPGDSGKIISAQFASEDGSSSQSTSTRLFLCCDGRTKDVVVTRTGYNVYTSEIIHALSTHPALGGSQTAVAGVKDRKGMFDEVCCWISVKASSAWEVGGKEKASVAAEIKEFLRGILAEYKVPAHVRFVEKIPLNRNGKIDARLLASTFQHDDDAQQALLASVEE